MFVDRCGVARIDVPVTSGGSRTSKIGSTRITEKGQATIPKESREKYDLDPGDGVWIDAEEGIVLRKAERTSARGMLVPDDTSREKREEIADELERRVRQHEETVETELLEDGA